MQVDFVTRSPDLDLASLGSELADALTRAGHHIQVTAHREEESLALDPTVISAVISAASAVLCALLMAVSTWITGRGGGKIVIVMGDIRLEVPSSGVSLDMLDELIYRTRLLQREKVRAVIEMTDPHERRRGHGRR